MISRIVALSATALVATTLATPASAQNRVRVGVLECRGGASIAIVVSQQSYSCVFRPNTGGRQRYAASVVKAGLNFGVTAGSVLAWAVYASEGVVRPGDLAGNYGGATAGASVGLGAGANALVGGSRNSFALQPLSVEGSAGVNVAVGVAELSLRYGQ
jgi:hypothetical protein